MPKFKQTKLPRSRPAKSARAPRSQNPGTQPLGDHHEQMLIGLTDPFSSEAASARYPDQGAGKSLTFQQRLATPLSSDANGIAIIALNPKVNFSLLTTSGVAGTVATWAATWSASFDVSTNLPNTYGRFYRPTSMGVRIANTLSATDSSGYLIIAKGGIPVVASTTTFAPSSFSSWDSHPMQQGGEWHVTSHPRSSNSYDLKDLTLTSGNTSNGDESWDTIYIAVFGAKASTPALYIEWYINFEYTAREDAVIAQMASPQPVLNVAMQTAVNQVQANLPSSHRNGHEAVKGVIKREAKKALVKHVIPFLAKKGVALLAAA